MHTSFDKTEQFRYSAPRPLTTDVYQSTSHLFDIRVTEMAGYDYVFAPIDLCDQITDFITLQDFLINIQALLGSELQRTMLIGVESREDGSVEMDRYDVEWRGTLVEDSRRTPLEGSSQFEFICMLYDYSSPLLIDR